MFSVPGFANTTVVLETSNVTLTVWTPAGVVTVKDPLYGTLLVDKLLGLTLTVINEGPVPADGPTVSQLAPEVTEVL